MHMDVLIAELQIVATTVQLFIFALYYGNEKSTHIKDFEQDKAIS